MKTKKKVAVGYIRVSTEEQTVNFSLEYQEEHIINYCEENNLAFRSNTLTFHSSGKYVFNSGKAINGILQSMAGGTSNVTFILHSPNQDSILY